MLFISINRGRLIETSRRYFFAILFCLFLSCSCAFFQFSHCIVSLICSDAIQPEGFFLFAGRTFCQHEPDGGVDGLGERYDGPAGERPLHATTELRPRPWAKGGAQGTRSVPMTLASTRLPADTMRGPTGLHARDWRRA